MVPVQVYLDRWPHLAIRLQRRGPTLPVPVLALALEDLDVGEVDGARTAVFRSVSGQPKE